jgi:hypothetical protein
VDKFEVFFDLVFVFSFFIITRATAFQISGRRLRRARARRALVGLGDPQRGHARVRLGGATSGAGSGQHGALFCFALALPQSFGDPRRA